MKIDNYQIFLSNFIYKALQILNSFLFPMALSQTEYVKYGYFFSIVNLFYILISNQTVSYFGKEYYKTKNIERALVYFSIFPVLFLFPLLMFFLDNSLYEIVVLLLASIFLLLSNISILFNRLEEKWGKYFLNQMIIAVPVSVFLIMSVIMGFKISGVHIMILYCFVWLGSALVEGNPIRFFVIKSSNFFDYLKINKKFIANMFLSHIFIYVVLGTPRLLAETMTDKSLAASLVFYMSLSALLFFLQELMFESQRPKILTSKNFNSMTTKITLISAFVSGILIFTAANLFIDFFNRVYVQSFTLYFDSIYWLIPFAICNIFIIRIRWTILKADIDVMDLVIFLLIYLISLLMLFFLTRQFLIFSELLNIVVPHIISLTLSIFFLSNRKINYEK